MKLNLHKNDKRKANRMTKFQMRKFSRWSWRASEGLPWKQGSLRARWARSVNPKSAW